MLNKSSKEESSELLGFEVDEVINNNENDSQSTKKKKKGSGGFQGMGFSFPVIKGIIKRGYKQPTPIQRKSIPLALEGKDLVAMARTGSGKTACFVLPILEKLIAPANKPISGKNFRALILSPTRELALQTLRFVRELGKFTGLTSAAILGGESIEQQFSIMSGTTPDIVVATPGRFLHICVEMSLKLDNIKVVVFDEADRLFELGFGDQLREILSRLPSNRQSMLFSATMPKMIVEFARAGLSDPVLIRLDVDWKLPSTLWLGWISVRAELKTAALLLLLDKVLTKSTPQAVVFAATKHHVEYLHLVLQKAGITSTYAYSGLDPSARKIALGKFINKKCSVLIVTDVAARGLDLPALDAVINYNFPAKPKLFVHRVGRSARAGRAGRAFSLVTAEDIAHLLDLHLFLGAELKSPEGLGQDVGPATPSGVWGTVQQELLEMRHQDVVTWEKQSSEIEEAARTCSRGWQQYVRWREAASADGNKRAKSTPPPLLTHPFLLDEAQTSSFHMVQQIHNYTPKGIHSICNKLPKEPLIGAYIGTEPVLIVKDPEYLKSVLTKDFYYFNSREVAEYSDREILTRNLFFTYGDNWRVLRQNLSPIFSSAKMKAMFPLVASKSTELERLIGSELSKSPVISVRSMCARFTMDVICSCVFGVESKVMTDINVKDNEFRQIADSIFESSTSRAFKFALRTTYPWLLYNSGQTVFPDKIHEFFSEIMLNVMDSRNGKPSMRNDFIDVMLGLKNEDYIIGDSIANFKTNSKEKVKIKVDDKLLIAQCVVFFAAGFETSSTTMSFVLYELARHPDVQEKASKEIDDYLMRTGGTIEFSCLTDLPFLEQCVDETLRLYPVLGAITREVYDDYTLPNTKIKIDKGLRVHIPIYHLHYSPEFWSDPVEFRPDRFSPENKMKIRPYTYIPFGEGPRLCIGMRFAKMQLMSGLVSILKKYTVMIADETPKKIVFDTKSFVTASASDIKLRFQLK